MNLTPGVPLCSYTEIQNTNYMARDKTGSLTFGGGAGAVRDAGTSLWCSLPMTAERHQPPDDSCLPGSCVTHNDSPTSLTAARLSQDLLQTCEEPIPANKRCLCGDAGDFKQQRFEHDVGLFEWHQSPCTERVKDGYVILSSDIW